MTSRAWWAPAAAMVAAPLVTWLPMLAARFPGLGLPRYPFAVGIDSWGHHIFWPMAMVVIATVVGAKDRWLAAAIALAGFVILYRGTENPTHAVIFTFGALALWAVRRAPLSAHERITSAVMALGVFEALYVLQQRFLHYDLLWSATLWPTLVKPSALIQPIGTLGTVDAAAAFIAITAPLMPWWLVPLPIVAVVPTQSLGAIAALVIGLGLKYVVPAGRAPKSGASRSGHQSMRRMACAALALAPLGWYLVPRITTLNKVTPRLQVWWFGLRDAFTFDPVLGYGLGGWRARIPVLQLTAGSPTGELWGEAHSEPVQWACELGVLGLIVLFGWLITHRRMFSHAVLGPSIAACAVTCTSFFTLHVVPTALISLVLIGLATAETSTLSPQEA